MQLHTVNNFVTTGRIIPATEQTPLYRVLVFGNSGQGKTRLVGEFAANERVTRVAFIDFERGSGSIREGHDKIDIFPVPYFNPKTKEMETVFRTMTEIFRYLRPRVLAGEYNTIVLDSVSSMAQNTMDGIRADTVAKTIQATGIPTQIDRGEYGLNTSIVMGFIRQFIALPAHFLMTSLAANKEDEVTHKKNVSLDLTASLAQDIPQFFDVVGYIELTARPGTDYRQDATLICRPDNIHFAKDRWEALPPKLTKDEVTMSTIFEYLDKAPQRLSYVASKKVEHTA